MYAQVFGGKSKEDILKQLIQVKNEIRQDDTNRIIEEQTLADRKSKFFEPVIKQQEKTEKQVKEISNIVNLKPEFPPQLINNERILVAVNRETLLDVTTRAYLDDRPLKAVEKEVSERKVDIERAIRRVENNNRIREDRKQIYLNNIEKIKLYIEYLSQYVNWRKNFKDLDKKEDQKGQGFSKSVNKCTILGTPQQVLEKLTLNIAAIQAGNTSNELRSETVDLLDYLHKYKHISKSTYTQFLKAVGILDFHPKKYLSLIKYA